MSPHNPNFEDKLNPLLSSHQMSLANAAKLDVTDDELDGYIAFHIRNYMQKDEGIPPLFYADENYIFEHLKTSFPDITMERVRHIIRKMEQHGFLIHQNGQWYSVKIPMANLPLKERTF